MNQKKKYAKPELEFVNFMMSSSIATTCFYDTPSYGDENTCIYEASGLVLFSDSNNKCNDTAGEYGFCYHVPQADGNIFNS